MRYSIWTDGNKPAILTMVEQWDRPRFANGEPDPTAVTPLYKFNADSWDEANIVFEEAKAIQGHSDDAQLFEWRRLLDTLLSAEKLGRTYPEQKRINALCDKEKAMHEYACAVDRCRQLGLTDEEWNEANRMADKFSKAWKM